MSEVSPFKHLSAFCLIITIQETVCYQYNHIHNIQHSEIVLCSSEFNTNSSGPETMHAGLAQGGQRSH